MANYYQNYTIDGLGTLSFTAPAASEYFVEGKLTLPTISNGQGASSVVVVVNQNGSPVYTGVAGATGFKTDIACAANDAITVVLSSSAAPDQGLNAVKGTVVFGQGQ